MSRACASVGEAMFLFPFRKKEKNEKTSTKKNKKHRISSVAKPVSCLRGKGIQRVCSEPAEGNVRGAEQPTRLGNYSPIPKTARGGCPYFWGDFTWEKANSAALCSQNSAPHIPLHRSSLLTEKISSSILFFF